MLILRLAWRSFLRHKRRSIITLAGIAISLSMMLIFVGLADDGHARMARMGIRMGAGYVLVQGAGYQEEQTLQQLVSHPREVLEEARSLPQVTQAVPRVRVSGLLTAGSSSAAVMISGVDPELEPVVSEIPSPKRIVSGEYLRPSRALEFTNQPADLYLGAELAKTLQLQVGDRTVLTASPQGAARPASAAFLVRGIFRSGISELDRAYVEIPLEEAQRLLQLGDKVVQVAVHLERLEDTEAVTAALRQALPRSLEVLPWQQALKELHDAIVLDDAGMYLMMGIIFVIIAIGIFNTVLMSVVERSREFGVMLALGTRPRQLFLIVISEVLILALIGAAIGLGQGLGLHGFIAAHGIDISSYAGDYEIGGIVMEGRIYSLLSAAVVTRWTLVVIGLTLAAALYPALRASRLRPLEAIHHA